MYGWPNGRDWPVCQVAADRAAGQVTAPASCWPVADDLLRGSCLDILSLSLASCLVARDLEKVKKREGFLVTVTNLNK